jgi:hypothetical protein
MISHIKAPHFGEALHHLRLLIISPVTRRRIAANATIPLHFTKKAKVFAKIMGKSSVTQQPRLAILSITNWLIDFMISVLYFDLLPRGLPLPLRFSHVLNASYNTCCKIASIYRQSQKLIGGIA